MTNQRPLLTWLYANAFLVLSMVVLGGITRLEGSGLSIVHWKPITGILPPLNHGDWVTLFQEYKTSPEFLKINSYFDLSDFQSIFWLEYLHRLLGRLVGLTFFLPGLWFWMRGYLTPPLKRTFIGMMLLGGLQGLMGWYMVKSGLVDRPHVSHYRLAAHLSLALLLYSWMLWTTFSLKAKRRQHTPKIRNTLRGVLGLLVVTILYGALVAGLKAGLLYNTFPKMGSTYIPPEIGSLTPWWQNLTENPVTVQLIHRCLAIFTSLITVIISWKHRKESSTFLLLFAAISLQAILGILTLLHHVPTTLATLHQLGAVIVLSLVLRALYGR